MLFVCPRSSRDRVLVELTQSQLSSRCSPGVLARASAHSEVHRGFFSTFHTTVLTVLSWVSRLLSSGGVAYAASLFFMHACVEKSWVFTSAVHMVYCSFLGPISNGRSIRIDVVRICTRDDVCVLHVFLEATWHVPCCRRDISQPLRHPLATEPFCVRRHDRTHQCALSCPSDSRVPKLW